MYGGKNGALRDLYSFSNSSISLVFCDEDYNKKPRKKYKVKYNDALLKSFLNNHAKKIKRGKRSQCQSVGRY